MKCCSVLGAVVAVVGFAPGVLAKSPAEIEQIAKSVSVKVLTGEGSGTIVHRQGDLYTIITNSHVVCMVKEVCTEPKVYSNLKLKAPDGRVYQVARSGIKLLRDGTGQPLDLAIVRFRSNQSYQVAQVADPDSLKIGDKVYTAGFPTDINWLFGKGEALAAVRRRLIGDQGGYTVIYDAPTLPGMSGGGAFDQQGRLVAIHGVGDRYTDNTLTTIADSDELSSSLLSNITGTKIGFNRGIAVSLASQGLAAQGILLGSKPTLNQSPASTATKADEFFVAGLNKLVKPGRNPEQGKREAIKQFDRAISLNPQYTVAYFARAYIKSQLNDIKGALADYNQAIAISPQGAAFYIARGRLKAYELKDFSGALADYNKAIELSPQQAGFYRARGDLKQAQFQDFSGALAEYNKAIEICQKTSKDFNVRDDGTCAEVFFVRSILKELQFKDSRGAIADLDQAIVLLPKTALFYMARAKIKYFKLNDAQGGIADLNQAIAISPNLSLAYYDRGVIKAMGLNDIPAALADLDRAIALNPKNAEFYGTRGSIKLNQLKNIPAALADFNQAIALLESSSGLRQNSISPKYALIYNNRGFIKIKLNDYQGALTDLNRAIAIDPKYAVAYNIRGILKASKLNDRPGAIKDLRMAAKLFRANGQTEYLQAVIGFLRELGATENP
jgi:tetratricopeptide (TPR) repeat protein